MLRILASSQPNIVLTVSELASSSHHAGMERIWTLQIIRVTLLTPTVVASVPQIAHPATLWLFLRSCTRSCGILEDIRTLLGTVAASSLSFTVSAMGKSIDQVNSHTTKLLTLITELDMASTVTTSLAGKATLCKRPWMLYLAANAPTLIAVFLKCRMPRPPKLARKHNKSSRMLVQAEHGSSSSREVLRSLTLRLGFVNSVRFGGMVVICKAG
jgi:hypothetical protein